MQDTVKLEESFNEIFVEINIEETKRKVTNEFNELGVTCLDIHFWDVHNYILPTGLILCLLVMKSGFKDYYYRPEMFIEIDVMADNESSIKQKIALALLLIEDSVWAKN
jgi:hypothetical protein